MNPSLIVCPIEFSAGGKSALGRALTLAQWHDAELHALYVRPGRARHTGSNDTANHSLQTRLVDFIRELSPDGLAVTPIVLTGDPAKAVAEYARLKSADLVVVGRNSRRGSRFWSPGVRAKDVARAVSCPTLTVSNEPMPDMSVGASFSNILCGIDFSTTSLRALREALTLAQQSGGRLTLVHVLEGFPGESVYSGSGAFRLIGEYWARVEKVKHQLRALVPLDALNWCEVDTEAVSGIPHGSILAVALARNADLVVIGSPRRTRLDRIVMASTVAGVLRRARCPVLAVPETSSVAETVSRPTTDRNDADQAVASLA